MPYVIFGHSHRAGDVPLPGGARYLNVGTWVPENETAYFVFCAGEGSGTARPPRLWRWDKQRHEPEPFAAAAREA